MVAPKNPAIKTLRAHAYTLAGEVRDQAFATFAGAWKRTSIASVLGAYATQVVDHLALKPLTGKQKLQIALAGGQILISFLLAQPGIAGMVGAAQLLMWLEALIEITCSEGSLA